MEQVQWSTVQLITIMKYLFIPDDYEGTFKYYCYLHSNMIKDFNIISEQDSEPESTPRTRIRTN